jgi:hypothetical protein
LGYGLNFSELFQDSVTEGLSQLLGEGAYQAWLQGSKLDLAVATADDVHEHLIRIFDETGADILERIVTRRLFTKLDNPEKWVGDFSSSVDKARELLANLDNENQRTRVSESERAGSVLN